MKSFAPPSRPLTDYETQFLKLVRTSPMGSKEWACARRLVKLGLGEIDGRVFRTNERGMVAVETGVPSNE